MTHEQIVAAIVGLCPGAEWSVSGDSYAGINWLDTTKTKPTEAELAAYVPPAPEPRLVPKRTIIDRLNTAGKLVAAMQALAAADLYTQQRWISRDSIYFNDPTCLAVMQAIGADPAVIMAPT
jgi:hypothetical protein